MCCECKKLKRIERRVNAMWALMFAQLKPGTISLTLIAERKIDMTSILKYRAALPAVPAGTDVANQQFGVIADGVAVVIEGVAQSAVLPFDAVSAEFEVPQDSNVTLTLAYVDDGGNMSAPQEQSFVAADTIAPDAPGPFGEVALIGERQIDG